MLLFNTSKHYLDWFVVLVVLICSIVAFRVFQVANATLPDKQINRGLEIWQMPVSNTKEEITPKSATTAIQAVLALPDHAWSTNQRQRLVLNQPKGDTWLRFSVNGFSGMENWLLEVAAPELDNVEIWFFQDKQLVSNYLTGDAFPFRVRPVNNESFVFPVPHKEGAPISVYMRISGGALTFVPLNLWQQERYLLHTAEQKLALGAFLGFIIAMALSNFFFFMFTRAVNFLLYCGYATSVALLLFSLYGFTYKFLWPESPWWQNHSVAVFANLSLMFALLFIRNLVDLRQYSAATDTVLKVLAGMMFFAIPLNLMDLTPPGTLFNYAVLLVVVYVFITGIRLWLKGMRVSRIYVFAWITLLLSASVASLMSLQWLTLGLSLPQVIMLGASLETLLLALLLAKNFSQTSDDLLTAREAALAQEKELRLAKEDVIAMQEQANEALEYKVQERTLELEITLRELAEKNQMLEEKNTLDALTGIKNRRYFDNKLLAEVRRSRREQTSLTLAMVDIDHFKQVNDRWGHQVGDQALQSVAETIQQFLKRPSDEVCRYGGEEFAIIMPTTDAEGARRLLNQIREQVQQMPLKLSDGVLHLTMSIGFNTVVVTDTCSEQDMLKQADLALYQAKNQGRNRVVSASELANDKSPIDTSVKHVVLN